MIVSIITAVYNNAATIEKCIQSVLSQSYKNIQYIVIDGNSTDGTKEIIEKYRHQIAVYISEPDKGIYDALNKGISKAAGDIVGLLHSDDVFENQYTIENIVAAFQNSQANVVYGNLVYVKNEDDEKIFRNWKSCPFHSKLLKKGWMPPHPTVFVKNDMLHQTGEYNLNYKIAADYDFILRLFSQKNINAQYLPQTITRMRTGGASNKGIGNIFRKSKEDYYILKRNKTGGILTLIIKNLSKLSQFFGNYQKLP